MSTFWLSVEVGGAVLWFGLGMLEAIGRSIEHKRPGNLAVVCVLLSVIFAMLAVLEVTR